MAGPLGEGEDLRRGRLLPEAQVLRAGHVPVPLRRRPARRPPRGLHRHGHPLPLQAREGLQCPAPDGLRRVRPPRRAVRRGDGHAPRDHDEPEHRDVHAPDQVARLLLRLGPRGPHLRPEVLQVDAVDLREALRAGPRLRRRGARELVPRPRHRPRQRGGDRRPLRARQPPGRPPPDAPVDAPDHRLRRASAQGHRHGRLARGHQGDAAQLDRQVHRCGGGLRDQGRRRGFGGRRGPRSLRRGRGLHHPLRHALRRDLHGDEPRARAREEVARGRSDRERGRGPRLPGRRRAQVRLRAHGDGQGQDRREARGPRGREPRERRREASRA